MSDQRCHETHYHADGTVTTRWVDRPDGVMTSTTSHSGTGTTHVSSHSGSSGGTSHSNSTTVVNGVRRTVTMTATPEGCEVVIDDRA